MSKKKNRRYFEGLVNEEEGLRDGGRGHNLQNLVDFQEGILILFYFQQKTSVFEAMDCYNLIQALESPVLPIWQIKGNRGERMEAGTPDKSFCSILGLGNWEMMVAQSRVVEVNMVRIMHIQDVFQMWSQCFLRHWTLSLRKGTIPNTDLKVKASSVSKEIK